MYNSNSKSRRYLCWLVFGSSTYVLYAFVASILTALISSLIWNWNKNLPYFVLGFHGCDREVADKILHSGNDHLNHSENDYDWLGNVKGYFHPRKQLDSYPIP